MIIYKVLNIKNNKVYIGQTTKLLNIRKKTHYRLSLTNPQTKFHYALRKYKECDFI